MSNILKSCYFKYCNEFTFNTNCSQQIVFFFWKYEEKHIFPTLICFFLIWVREIKKDILRKVNTFYIQL